MKPDEYRVQLAKAVRALLLCGVLFGLAGEVHADPFDFELQSNRLGNADSFGYARLMRELGRMELADGRAFPFQLVFETNPRRAPGAFGPYWHLPLFASTVAQFNQYQLYWDGPDGARRFFALGHSAESRQGGEVFEHRGRDWRATKDRRGRVTVEATEQTGWSYLYEEGRLVEFRLGEGSATYRVTWSGRGLPSYLSDLSSNRRVFEIEYRGSTDPERIVIGDKTVEVEMGDGAVIAPDGETPFRNHRVSFLRRLRLGEGEEERFEYEKERRKPEALPGRASAQLGKDLVKGVRDIAVNRLRIRNGEREDFVEWEAQSGFIVADSGADYAVHNGAWDPLNRKADLAKVAPKAVKLRRLPEPGAEEVWGYDWPSGLRTYTDAATGEVFRDLYLLAEGPTDLKLRKREKRTKDGWELVEQRSYDPLGRLIRVRSGSFLRNVQYIEDSERMRIIELEGGVLQREEIWQEGKILKRILYLDGLPQITTTVSYSRQGSRRLVRSSKGETRETHRDSSGRIVAVYLNEKLHYTVKHTGNGLFREKTVFGKEGSPKTKFYEKLNDQGRIVGKRVEDLAGTSPTQTFKYVYDNKDNLVNVTRSSLESK